MKTKTKAKQLPLEECALFCDQVALILSAGIPLYDGMDALADNFADTRYEPVFRRMDAEVKRTGSLYEAVADAGVFPPYLAGMLRVGEQTGKLETVTRAMGVYYAREHALSRAVRQAVTYPLSLMIMMAIVIAVLIVRVLPIFEQVYASLGSSLSGPAGAMVQIGSVTGRVALALVALACLVALAFSVCWWTGRRRAMLRLLRTFPMVKRLLGMLSASRFSSVMALMMAGGYPLDESVQILPGVFDDEDARAKIDKLSAALADGSSFADAVERAGIYQRLHVKMLRVGVLAGQTDAVLEKLGGIYQEQLDEEISGVVGAIEPTIVAVLSIVIGGILLSVMLPLAGIMASII